ncbi:lipocalin family protein [Chitinophaga sp. Cy-1792]|uniref:lipocalin family protein n=1 Tax=Chitinophaga sp. Cy-1792 TaxID=2608339 RepID=UPI001422E9CD|nr:lipocalin family protein [Chitinophaga sp. Cy-1792]NIG54041.1 lipocalin [Chitinophaga sp. Cy-1792]
MRRKLLTGAALAAGVFLYVKGRSVSIPKGATAVRPFILKKYLGTWYELAHLDYRFESHMNNVSSTYSLKPGGKIEVDSKGFDETLKKWKIFNGKAKFVKDKAEGRFMISFFPFMYVGHNVIDITDAYDYALIAGDSLHYLWIFSRTTTIPENVKMRFLTKAKALGYDVKALRWTKHDAA